MISERRQHAREDLEAKVVFIAQAVSAALDDADLVVQALDEAESDFVLWLAVRGDAVPVSLDHVGEVFVGRKALPLQLRAPVIEELACPGLAVVIPQLGKRLLEHIGGVQALVGGQQESQILPGRAGEVLRMGQQGVLLAFDELALVAFQARVLGLAHTIQGLAQVAQHVELIEQDSGLRGFGASRVAERLPHVHHGEAHLFGLLFPEKCVELVHARLAAILPAKPDRARAFQITDHDAVDMALADGDLIDPDHLGTRLTGSPQLFAQALLLQILDGVPVKVQLLGNVLDAAGATAPTDVPGEALGVERVVGQELQSLALHGQAAAATYAPHFQLQVHPCATARQIPHAPLRAIVPRAMHHAAGSTARFFARRTSLMSRALRSPKTPCTVAKGRNPAKAYKSCSRRCRGVFAILRSCQNSLPQNCAQYPMKMALAAS